MAAPKESLAWIHFEGCTYRGWRPRVLVVLCYLSFVVAERERAFPPWPSEPSPGKNGVVETMRLKAFPGRHFANTFIAVRLSIARS